MAQQQQLRWSQLKVGILTITSLVLFSIAIFFISGQIGFFTKKIRLHTHAPDAGGLKSGAPVRLAGIEVGNVRAVRISGLPGSSQGIEIEMEVAKTFQPQIKIDSEAYLAAEGLLGERYINITMGTPPASSIGENAEIKFHATAEFSELVGGSRDLIDNLNSLTSRVNNIFGEIDNGKGTIGKLIKDDSLYRRIDATVAQGQSLIADVSAGKGSIGRLISSDEFYQHVDATVLQAKALIERADTGDGTIAKLLHDPSLYQNKARLISYGSQLVDNINQGKGTLGKLATDDELYKKLNSATTGINQVLTSLNNGEGSMGRLLHDPALYNNLNSTSVTVRELLADFRQNPKKFLTIQFKIF